MSATEKTTVSELIERLVRSYNYGSGYEGVGGFDDNLTSLFEIFGYEYDEASETQGGYVKTKSAWIGLDLADLSRLDLVSDYEGGQLLECSTKGDLVYFDEVQKLFHQAVLRDDVLELAAKACEEIESDLRDAYKGRGKYEPMNPRRADTNVDAQSDGAGQCAQAIRALKTCQKNDPEKSK